MSQKRIETDKICIQRVTEEMSSRYTHKLSTYPPSEIKIIVQNRDFHPLFTSRASRHQEVPKGPPASASYAAPRDSSTHKQCTQHTCKGASPDLPHSIKNVSNFFALILIRSAAHIFLPMTPYCLYCLLWITWHYVFIYSQNYTSLRVINNYDNNLINTWELIKMYGWLILYVN